MFQENGNSIQGDDFWIHFKKITSIYNICVLDMFDVWDGKIFKRLYFLWYDTTLVIWKILVHSAVY